MAETATVRLTGIELFGRIGHTEEERIVGTHIEIDVELEVRLTEGSEHELAGTIDYREVHRRIQAVVEGGDHPLLEGLTKDLLDALEPLEWQAARVKVRKPKPPFQGSVRAAEVEMSRER